MPEIQSAPAKKKFHPAKSPRQRTLRRRINNASVYRTMRRAIRDCKAEEPILLAPCGYGWFFERYQRDGIKFVGIDIDTLAVEHARTAITPEPKIVEGSILEMPFKDGEFDFIVSNRFLLHFPDEFRAKAIKELARVTRRYLLVHYDYPVSIRQFFRKLRGAKQPVKDTEHFDTWRKTQRAERKLYYTREMMAAEGAIAGLTIKKLYFVAYLISDRVYCLFEKNKS